MSDAMEPPFDSLTDDELLDIEQQAWSRYRTRLDADDGDRDAWRAVAGEIRRRSAVADEIRRRRGD